MKKLKIKILEIKNGDEEEVRVSMQSTEGEPEEEVEAMMGSERIKNQRSRPNQRVRRDQESKS